MYFWNSYPFIRFSIVFILGILCFDYNPKIWTYSSIYLGLGIILYFTLVFISSKYSYYKLRYWNGALGLSILFFLGGYLTEFQYCNPGNTHYTKLRNKNNGFSGTIINPANERTNFHRYDFNLNYVITENDSLKPTTGKIHLYVRKDSLNNVFQYGDELQVLGDFFAIDNPGNPGEFNYKTYLQRQKIYSHAFVDFSEIRLVRSSTPNLLLSLAFTLRSNAKVIIDKHISSSRENGIATAILLGIKDHIDNDIKKAYSSAGAMHVLAVSGLHVGIIFLIIKLLFGKLKDIGKWGRYSFGLISIILIWFYAMITGLSPSVLRAATMFSLVSLGETSIRENNVYNSLGIAAFTLLSFEPYLIYSVGFQLSFAAVFGIVYFQPKLYSIIAFKYWILDKVWAITCVSIAAQLSTFPLTAYYFHQFPTYFLISNIVVIPASFIMLVGGILVIFLDTVFSQGAELIGYLLQKLIWIINEIISQVQGLPNSLIEWIYIDRIGLVLIYAIVFTLTAGIQFRTFKTLIVSAILSLYLISHSIIENESQSKKNELIFYDIPTKLAVDHVKGHSAQLYIDDVSENELELLSYQIDPFRLKSHLKPLKESFSTFQSAGFTKREVLLFGMLANKKIVVFDSTTFHLSFKNTIEIDYIIINNNSVKSLKWLKDRFAFERLIISPKNSIYYSRKMKSQAKKLGLNLHSIKEDGALIIELNSQ